MTMSSPFDPGRARPRLASPEALCFTAGGGVLAIASLWWAWVQARGGSLDAPVPATVVHSVAMVFGAFPLFFCGFMFGPGMKWLKQPALTARALAPATVIHVAGMITILASAHHPAGFAAALWLVAGGWAWSWLRLLRVIAAAPAERRTHHRVFLLASTIGLLGVCGAALSASAGEWRTCLAIARAGVWLYVGPTFVAAAERMIPFLSGTPFDGLDARHPSLLPRTLGVLLAGQALVEAMPHLGPIVGTLQTLAGSAMLAIAVRWLVVRRLRPRLLRMLFTGFVWLGVTWLLCGWNGLRLLAPGSAPLHAFTIGFLGTTMLAMLSRFASARAGRHEVVDRLLWTLFVLLQCTALVRVFGPQALGAFGLGPRGAWIAAASAWAVVWIAWTIRYGGA